MALFVVVRQTVLKPYVVQASDAARVLGVYQSYKHINQPSQPASRTVLFWGSSMMREALDTRIFEAEEPGWRAFNLGISGDLPQRRLVELPLAIQAKPDSLVIGVTVRELMSTYRIPEDHITVLPPEAYQSLPHDFLDTWDERALQAASKGEWERFWWPRKFWLSAFLWRIGVPDRREPFQFGAATNLVCPNVYSKPISLPELQRSIERQGHTYSPYTDAVGPNATNSRSARAFTTTLAQLRSAGIRPRIVSMPLHPALNEILPKEKIALYQVFLSSLAQGDPVIDLRTSLQPADFIDLVHVSASGRTRFSRQLAEAFRIKMTAESARAVRPLDGSLQGP